MDLLVGMLVNKMSKEFKHRECQFRANSEKSEKEEMLYKFIFYSQPIREFLIYQPIKKLNIGLQGGETHAARSAH